MVFANCCNENDFKYGYGSKRKALFGDHRLLGLFFLLLIIVFWVPGIFEPKPCCLSSFRDHQNKTTQFIKSTGATPGKNNQTKSKQKTIKQTKPNEKRLIFEANQKNIRKKPKGTKETQAKHHLLPTSLDRL